MLPERAEDLAKDYHDQDFTRSTEAGGDKQAVVTKEGTVTEEKKEDAAEAPLQADEVARDAIEEFVLPAGWERVPSPKGKSANRSPMWSFGVKARRIGAESGKSGKMYAFFCLGGEACRQRSAQSSVTVYVGEMTNSNAIKHIRAFHAVKSSVTDRRDEPTRSFSEKKGDEIVSSLAMKDNPSRTMALEVVKAFVIQEFCSLSFGEKESMRVCWNVTCKEGFPVMGLHRQAVKHNIVELYNATVSRFRDELKAHTAKRQMLHVNFELWTDMFSNLTFLGVRVWFVDVQWQLQSRLLSVRQFSPTVDVNESVLRGYLLDVLEEFQLTEKCVFSTTTEARGLVRRLAGTLVASRQEWCIANMLDTTLFEAVGFNPPLLEKSKNEEARTLLGLVKKTVGRLREAAAGAGASGMFEEDQVKGFDKCLQLVDAGAQRWTCCARLLERVLLSWDAIHATASKGGRENPITGRKTELQEMFSIIEPVSEVIANVQATGEPSGADALLRMAKLRVTTLNPARPLEVISPRGSDVEDPEGLVMAHGENGGSWTVSEKTKRSHAELTPVARVTRELLREAVESSWFRPRYNPGTAPAWDPVFDMHAMCHPALSNLVYIEKMVDSDAEYIKVRIEKLFLELAASMADEVEQGPTSPEPAPRPSKRGRSLGGSVDTGARAPAVPVFAGCEGSANVAWSNELLSLGIVTTVPRTNFEKAKDELGELRKVPGVGLANVPLGKILEFWRSFGEAKFPLLARAARTVLGVPASSRRIDYDFSGVRRILSAARDKAECAWVEMILCLHGNIDLIPLSVPELTTDEVSSVIPQRMRTGVPDLECVAVQPLVEFVDVKREEGAGIASM